MSKLVRVITFRRAHKHFLAYWKTTSIDAEPDLEAFIRWLELKGILQISDKEKDAERQINSSFKTSR